MAKSASKTYTAPALEKGLDIIELLSTEEVGLTQSEIARALGRSVGEIFRMLMVLESRGYVVQDPVSDRYLLTTFIFEIAHRIPKIGRLTSFAQPLMQALSKRINQSVHLAVLSADAVLVVGQSQSPGNNVLSVRLGAKIDLWHASSGRVILAFQEPDLFESMTEIVPLPKNVTKSALRKEFARIREMGVETRDSFVVRGVVNISVPIIDHSGWACAALTIPHIERLDQPPTFEACKDELVAAAAAISKSLGGRPPQVS